MYQSSQGPAASQRRQGYCILVWNGSQIPTSRMIPLTSFLIYLAGRESRQPPGPRLGGEQGAEWAETKGLECDVCSGKKVHRGCRAVRGDTSRAPWPLTRTVTVRCNYNDFPHFINAATEAEGAWAPHPRPLGCDVHRRPPGFPLLFSSPTCNVSWKPGVPALEPGATLQPVASSSLCRL